MTGTIDSFTLISIIILLVIVFKLRSVLGRHTEDDESRIRAKAEEQRQAAAAAAKSSDKVVTLPRRNREEPQVQVETAPAETEARIKTIAGQDPLVQTGLLDILKADPAFDPEQFVKGARAAYEMIVTAFAEGDRKTLRELLAKDVFDDFTTAIGERERRGERIEQRFIGINRADILQAELERGVAQITVRFDSQLTKATYGKTGNVVEGTPDKVLTPTDIFTFSRDVSSPEARRDPNWRLIATSTSN